jgi:acetyl esterase/lipase
MKSIPVACFLLGLSWLLSSCLPPKASDLPDGSLLLLWPEGVPNCPVDSAYRETMDPEIGRKTMAVQDPSLEVFLPPDSLATGQAVLICPGGGYYLQAYDKEGTRFADWFVAQGIAAFVLKYRLPYWSGPGCRDHVASDDATRALRLIRSRARTWGINPQQVGVMGFSAGGHLASTVATPFVAGNARAQDPIERVSSRPDFVVLVYPVITGDTAVSHSGSFRNLLGKTPSEAELRQHSTDLQVGAHTPPTFLIHASDDRGVPAENSIRFYQALLAHGVPAELHVFPSGGHGFAFAPDHPELKHWPDLLSRWLATHPSQRDAAAD